MRRILSLVLLAIPVLVSAQSSFYIKLGGGYSFPLSSYDMGTNSEQTLLRTINPETGAYVPAIITKQKEVRGSHGTGLNISAAVGYNFTDVVGVEISANYIDGKEYKTSALTQDILDDGNTVTTTNRGVNNMTSASTVMLISPSLRLTAPGGLFRPYLSAGPLLGFVNIKNEYYGYSDYDGVDEEIRHEKFSGGLSIGMRGALGVDIRLSDAFALFSEVAFNSISYYPKEKEITKYEVNGEDKLPAMAERDRRTVYVKSLSTDTRNRDLQNEADQPGKAIRISFPVSNVMATIGVRLAL